MNTKFLLAAILPAFALTAGSANAVIVVQDGFSGAFVAGNGAIVGRTPDTVNLAGNTYTEQQNANVGERMQLDTTTGSPGTSLRTGFNNAAHIQYTNTGVPTALITLSIDAQINTIANNDTAPRGIGLGFYNNPLAGTFFVEPSANTNFTGLVVTAGGSDGAAGTLEYVLNGASQGVFTTALAGFSTSAFINLSYTVDPTTGTLTNVTYGGTDYTASFAAVNNFVASDIAGFYGQTSNNIAFFGRVDNFAIDVVPEPSSLALLGLGGLLVARRRRS